MSCRFIRATCSGFEFRVDTPQLESRNSIKHTTRNSKIISTFRGNLSTMKNIYFALALLLTTTLWSQESSDKDSIKIKPFEVTSLTTAAEETDKTLRDVREAFDKDKNAHQIYQEYLTVLEKYANLREDTVSSDLRNYNLWALTDIDNDWSAYEKEIESLKEGFSKLTEKYQEALNTSTNYYDRWVLTKTLIEEDIPEPLMVRIKDMMTSLDLANSSLKDSLNTILTNYDIVAREHNNIIDVKKLIQDISTDKRLNIFAKDSEPLLKAFKYNRKGDNLVEQFGGTFVSSYQRTENFLKDNSGSAEFQLILLFLLWALFFYVWRLYKKSDLDKEKVDSIADFLINRPFRMGIIFALFLSFWVYDNPPTYISTTIMLLVLLSFLFVIRGIVGKTMSHIYYFMTFLFVLNYFENFMTSYPLTQRIMILAQSLLVLASMIYLLSPKSPLNKKDELVWNKVSRTLFPIFILLSILSIYGNLSGSLFLARVLTKTMVISITVGSVLLLIYAVTKSLINLLLMSNAHTHFNLLQAKGNIIKQKFLMYLRLYFYYLWIKSFLNQIGLLTYITESIDTFLETGQTFGNVYLSVGQVVSFIVILLVFSIIANIIRDLLSIEILPRFNMKKGVPMTTGTLTYYIILVLGFLMAVAAAGVSLDKLGFMAGALGVGIGFGLQNVVGNFVSGLILIFERPVRVDDVISTGLVEGTITDIGIRASKIRDYNGAEIIVPNMDLISQQVTNWTLSDSKRRRELFIKVEYGTDPNKVIELILGVIHSHKGVVHDSYARVLFLGFQEYSLDFRVLFWTTENMMVTTSEVAIGIYNVLKEAGIKIPIPKREVIEAKPEPKKKATKKVTPKKNEGKPDEKTEELNT